jgi:hypothetical protein
LQYRCGAKAANDLDAFIAGRPVSCLLILLDRYGRTVATCVVGRQGLGDWLVGNGLALDWPEYSKRKYDAAQRDAEQAGEEYGQAVTSSRGFSGYAFGRAGVRQTVRMMRKRIPKTTARRCSAGAAIRAQSAIVRAIGGS